MKKAMRIIDLVLILIGLSLIILGIVASKGVSIFAGFVIAIYSVIDLYRKDKSKDNKDEHIRNG